MAKIEPSSANHSAYRLCTIQQKTQYRAGAMIDHLVIDAGGIIKGVKLDALAKVRVCELKACILRLFLCQGKLAHMH